MHLLLSSSQLLLKVNKKNWLHIKKENKAIFQYLKFHCKDLNLVLDENTQMVYKEGVLNAGCGLNGYLV